MYTKPSRLSDSHTGKKMEEEAHLHHFLDAYATVTGARLRIVSSTESPDFICARPCGQEVGIELARSPHDYEHRIHDHAVAKRAMRALDLLDAICQIITEKELLRQSAHWRLPNRTILVITLLDYSFDSLAWAKDPSVSNDYARTGFLEIWLTDYSTLDAYGEVRLIGLHPRKYWGTHNQPALEGKSFG